MADNIFEKTSELMNKCGTTSGLEQDYYNPMLLEYIDYMYDSPRKCTDVQEAYYNKYPQTGEYINDGHLYDHIKGRKEYFTVNEPMSKKKVILILTLTIIVYVILVKSS
jgi:hypothetical protein